MCVSPSELYMMTSSNGNIFRVTGPLCGVPVKSPHKGQWRGALMFTWICIWINGWVNNHEAGDLRRHRGHYDVNVMKSWICNGLHIPSRSFAVRLYAQAYKDLVFFPQPKFSPSITHTKKHALSSTGTLRIWPLLVSFHPAVATLERG